MTFPNELHPSLLRAVADLGWSAPTPIQQKALPPGLEGRDVLACAMTGSGKTAAFLLPILQQLRDRPRGTTRALVLAPTRELATQIVVHFHELARHTKLRAAAVYGGVGMAPQERAFRQGVDVVVACPGRLLDHFQYPYARLEGLEILVLDEADRMLDMGFLPDIRRVLRHVPEPRQTMLFSATLPAPIVELSKELLDAPARIDVERKAAPAAKVRQSIFPVRADLKSRLLLALLEREPIDQAIVFTRTKHRADRLSRYLSQRDVACDRIHGNRSQAQRTKALEAFKRGETKVLVATDIAARGIDVSDLSHVVNFDVPNLPEDYIHRVGRTARAGASGEAFTLVSPQEHKELRAIERAVGESLPRRTIEGFDHDAPRQESLEIPLKDRIAAIRTRRAEDRARTQAKVTAKAAKDANGGARRPALEDRREATARDRRAHAEAGRDEGNRHRPRHAGRPRPAEGTNAVGEGGRRPRRRRGARRFEGRG